MKNTDLQGLISDLEGYKTFLTTAKEQMGEEAYQFGVAQAIETIKNHKTVTEAVLGISVPTVNIVDIFFNVIEANPDFSDDDKELGKAWLVVALFELEPELLKEIEQDASTSAAEYKTLYGFYSPHHQAWFIMHEKKCLVPGVMLQARLEAESHKGPISTKSNTPEPGGVVQDCNGQAWLILKAETV